MADEQVFRTVIATVVSGTAVAVGGQLINKLWLDPVQEMRRLIGRISHCLIVDAPGVVAPNVCNREYVAALAERLRNFSAEIDQQKALIPAYEVAAMVRLVPYAADLRRAADALMLLSNRLGRMRSDATITHGYLRQEILDALGLPVHPDKITKAEYSEALRQERLTPWPDPPESEPPPTGGV